jgi:hypothetical protein
VLCIYFYPYSKGNKIFIGKGNALASCVPVTASCSWTNTIAIKLQFVQVQGNTIQALNEELSPFRLAWLTSKELPGYPCISITTPGFCNWDRGNGCLDSSGTRVIRGGDGGIDDDFKYVTLSLPYSVLLLLSYNFLELRVML